MGHSPANPAFVEKLSACLPPDTIRPAEAKYLQELRGKWHGKAGCIALPRTTADVSAILSMANEGSVPVVPYGGGTGLVCGQVYPDGPNPVVLSLERMNKITSVDPVENVITAEAGAILDNLHMAAEGVNRLFPLSIASSGTAQIGGNLATNAGGVNVLRYGNARDLCLGLEAVLPDGRVWNGLSRLRKDNTGYDLKNLLIGSEGSLGVITKASLKLFARPSSFGTAMLVVKDPTAALDLLALAREKAGEAISAFELIHANGFRFLTEKLPQVSLPFTDPPEWSVLVDLGLSADQDGQSLIEAIFSDAFETGLVSDGVVASSEAQRQALWAVRETIPDANRAVGSIASHDVSLPLRSLPDFIEAANNALAAIGDMRINCFGHLGDGNLHFNVFPPFGKSRNAYSDAAGTITNCVHDMVDSYDGSVSAEHGIGRAKTADLARYKDPVALAFMADIKKTLDPNGIMNPGVIFPADASII